MNAERWPEVERVFHEALEQRAEDRDAWLAEACAGDDDLQAEVRSLLEYQDLAERFIESPALELAASVQASGRAAAAAEGQTIHQYRILSALAAGGMGEVYLAEDTRLGRRVALKLPAADLPWDREHLRRFEREARAIAALSHPNVCAIHEVIETAEGRQCIVMEYVEGATLREHLSARSMDVAEALDVAIQVASALSAAHAAGIVHRDIKPENIMLRSDGYVKVLDFGLAKQVEPPVDRADALNPAERSTGVGAVMGTVRYMSPEQTRGLPVDWRTDIWSLGVILYEMVSGRPPFAGPSVTEVIIAIGEEEPTPLTAVVSDMPLRFEEIVGKALEKNREDRYPSANDVLLDAKKLRQELDFARAAKGPDASGPPVSRPVGVAQETAHVLFHANQALPLEEGENIIGRDSAARVRFGSGSLSRQHAAIVVDGEDATIVDLGSKNGTFVDGERVLAPRLLRDGMTLRFGTVDLVYRRVSAQRATESID